MTRIVGGSARGRRLTVPDTGTRPTSDRAREAVFSSLESLRGSFVDAVVLDLYAGSGALGLEALSRGATHVDLVESDRQAAWVVEANRSVVGSRSSAGSSTVLSAGGTADVHAITVERWLTRSQPGSGYDVVFCDPPYSVGAVQVGTVLETLSQRQMLADGAVVVVERGRRDPAWTWPPGFVAIRDRVYGEAHLWIGALAGG
ncbi:MAG: 16S rRNA (guanine(966)-N(2))-methyltransferase RsmD [Actinomycetia bacterium]|nr:16S rRNA (guanine(966)-N(2))-methyltransferase RsmD [Actinomycetes bacterium]